MSTICFSFDAFRRSFIQSFRFSWFFFETQISIITENISFTYSVMSSQFETINFSKSYIYIIETLSRISWSVWLNDAIRIRVVFSSRLSVLVESHFYWFHYDTYYLWFAFFRIDHHLLYPIWWRHFTPGKYVSRDLSFLLLNLTICLRRRCYRGFYSSSKILFWFYVDSAGGSFDNMSWTLRLINE